MTKPYSIAASLKDRPEIGKKLNLWDLRLDTVVVLVKKGDDKATTMWVSYISAQTCHFTAHVLVPSRTLVLSVWAGELQDDAGNEIEVFEYLGAV